MAVDVGGRGGEARVVGDGVGPDLVPDGVDAGDFDVLHVADEVAFGAGEVHLHLFVVEVDLVGDAVLGAPDALRLEEAVAEHLGEDVVVVALGAEFGVGEFERPHRRSSWNEGWIGGRGGSGGSSCGAGSRPRTPAELRQEDGAEVGADVVALELLEGVEEIWGPGQAGDGVVGLVAAEAEDGGAEELGHGLVVAVVGGLDVGRGGFGVEVVLERLGGVLGVGGIGVALGGRGAEDVLDEGDSVVGAGGRGPGDAAVVDGNGDAVSAGGWWRWRRRYWR